LDHKAPDAFRTISEVADELDLPQHVLRFWESRFREIKPMKRGGGRRYYRPDDVDLLRGIRHLLYGEGYTIRGVQRILREQGSRFVEEVWREGAAQPPHLAVEDQDFDDEATRGSPDEADADRGADLPERLPGGRDTGEREADGRREPRLTEAPRRAYSQEGAEALAPSARHAESFTREDVAKLKAALDELGECRKLLDEALAQTG
jgi:DNA-binding transcriptional MerR regulator